MGRVADERARQEYYRVITRESERLAIPRAEALPMEFGQGR